MNRTKIVIVGAGAAGLCAAKHIILGQKFHCTIFEQTGDVGGTWQYTDEIHNDKFGLPIHSSMYQLLKTNLPKEVMRFSDFPFSPSEESFLHHTKVLEYLKKYAEHFGLYKYIKFRVKVESVKPILNTEPTKWKVLTHNLKSKAVEEHIFDAVMVCNGHYSEPKVPDIPGLRNFKGLVMHSHDYRKSDPFKAKNVAVWGASVSGVDISLEISQVAKMVSICQRFPNTVQRKFPENIKQAANIVSAEEKGFVLEDGTTCDADALLYCTGYVYNFPFLTKDCKIEVIENCVKPLYKHLINIEHPTMCLLGIPYSVVPFIMFDYQVQFFLKVLNKSVVLPSKEDMLEDSEKELDKRVSLGMPVRYAHKMEFLQWDYFDDLATLAKVNKFPRVLRKIYEDVKILMKNDITQFKNYKYEILDSENFRNSKLSQ